MASKKKIMARRVGELHESGECRVCRGDSPVRRNSFRTVKVTEFGFRVRVCQDRLIGLRDLIFL